MNRPLFVIFNLPPAKTTDPSWPNTASSRCHTKSSTCWINKQFKRYDYNLKLDAAWRGAKKVKSEEIILPNWLELMTVMSVRYMWCVCVMRLTWFENWKWKISRHCFVGPLFNFKGTLWFDFLINLQFIRNSRDVEQASTVGAVLMSLVKYKESFLRFVRRLGLSDKPGYYVT